MRKLILVASSLLVGTLLLSYPPPEPNPFLEKPYLQLGDAARLAPSESLVPMWHSANVPAEWKVEVRTSKDKSWRAVGVPWSQIVSAPEGEPAVAVKDGGSSTRPLPTALAASPTA